MYEVSVTRRALAGSAAVAGSLVKRVSATGPLAPRWGKPNEVDNKMNCMMMDGGMMGGAMMLSMGLTGLLLIAVLVLAAVALVKYIRSESGR